MNYLEGSFTQRVVIPTNGWLEIGQGGPQLRTARETNFRPREYGRDLGYPQGGRPSLRTGRGLFQGDLQPRCE